MQRLTVAGPFDLAFQNGFFNGWPEAPGAPGSIVQAFPVEGSWAAAAVVMRQDGDDLVGEVHGAGGDAAFAQGAAALSADIDGTGWPGVGEREPAIGTLQRDYHWMRPSLFHSPYEAAAAFVIGHRISIAQTRRIRARIAEEHGEHVDVGGTSVAAFPSPEAVLGIEQLPGLAPAKVERLHGVARAALDGTLDRATLRAVPVDEALARVQRIPGIGPFFAQGILFRGAGVVDAITTDGMSLEVVGQAFDLGRVPSAAEAVELTAAWSPFRMWTMTLLHVQARAARGRL